jgi:hypothetical protein
MFLSYLYLSSFIDVECTALINLLGYIPENRFFGGVLDFDCKFFDFDLFLLVVFTGNKIEKAPY